MLLKGRSERKHDTKGAACGQGTVKKEKGGDDKDNSEQQRTIADKTKSEKANHLLLWLDNRP